MRHYLLIDFGATHTKAALVEVSTGNIVFPYVLPSLVNEASLSKHYEISAFGLQNQFQKICDYYANSSMELEGVHICSQMHGFLLIDAQTNLPLTSYLSWRDERSLIEIDGLSTFALVAKTWGNLFKEMTGMPLRPGLPIVNLLHLIRLGGFAHQRIKLVTLPEWLALSHQSSFSRVHPTMVAGTGFFDVKQGKISQELISFIKEFSDIELIFNEVAPENTIAGFVSYRNKKIPMYVGVGDHPCALLGAGNHSKSISINMGTGSQVSRINGISQAATFEKRPYFGKSYLLTQTHIPAGRVLSEYVNFLSSVCHVMTGTTIDAWSFLTKISAEEILNASLEMDLAMFQGAFNFQGGGKINKISEENLTCSNYLASLLKSFLMQYVPVIASITAGDEKIDAVILSGGIPRKLPILKEVLACMIDQPVIGPQEIDETLLGLRYQALAMANEVSAEFL